MLITKVADVKRVEIVADLADTIWHEYFTPIIGKAQVNYMLEKFQSKESIIQQIHNGVVYFLMIDNSEPIGYAAIVLKNRELFLSKFYIISSERSKGFGKQTIQFLEQLAMGQNADKICLTVNKDNLNTIKAYEKMGFVNLGSVIKSIGEDFVMDDFKMEKYLHNAALQ